MAAGGPRTVGRPRSIVAVTAELQAIVHAMTPSVYRSFSARYRDAVSRGVDIGAWERERLAEFRAKTPSAALAVPVKPSRAELKEQQEAEDRKIADHLFEKVGEATDVLFEGKIPGRRVIEIAEWQVETMRMLRR